MAPQDPTTTPIGLAVRIVFAIGVWVFSFMWTGLAYLADSPDPNLALSLSPIYFVTGLLTGLLLPRMWFLVLIPAFVPIARGDLLNVAALFVGSGFVGLLSWRFRTGADAAERNSKTEDTDLEKLSREEKCIYKLQNRGYRVVVRRNAWIVHEPLGGRVKIRSLDELEEYAQSK